MAEGFDLYAFHHVLDFGCGCARVLRFFADHPHACQFYGTDIDAELIEWCKTLPRIAEFGVNGHLPPTRYEDAKFDFIYCVSVFSHLNEEMQFAWLKELKRISKPGGILLISVIGSACLEKTSQKLLESKGIVHVVGQTGFLKLDGLPDFYQTTWHSKNYIHEKWGRLFKIVRHVDKAINSHQDAVILENE